MAARILRVALGFATALVLEAPAAAQTIVNGSFESGTTSPWVAQGAVTAGIQALFAAPDGGAGAIIGFTGANAAGTFSQDFNTASAGLFEVSFYLGRGESTSGSNDVPLTFRALLDGQLVADQLPSSVTSVPFFTQFDFYSKSLNLASGSHTLAFEFSRGETLFGRGPFFVLDGVGVAPRAVTNAVPEPATWAMMIVGFGVVGSALRRGDHRLDVSHA